MPGAERSRAMRLIGFDVRSAPAIPDLSWTAERRSLFLLRDDVKRPLSVDQQVWPSVFAEAASDEWRGVLEHWSDLAAMTMAVKSSGQSTSDMCYVATAIMWEFLSIQAKDDWSSNRLDAAVATSVGPEWDVLGYDIADQWLVSGLSNCGYIGRERDEWRLRWSHSINSHHLFDDPSEAHVFARTTDNRVEEHAPFFVYCVMMAPFALGERA